jgi:hypothetical protein
LPRDQWIEIPVPALVDEPTFALAQERLAANRQLAAYSKPFRSPIPRQIDHRFHANPITDSTAIRSVIPRQIDR